METELCFADSLLARKPMASLPENLSLLVLFPEWPSSSSSNICRRRSAFLLGHLGHPIHRMKTEGGQAWTPGRAYPRKRITQSIAKQSIHGFDMARRQLWYPKVDSIFVYCVATFTSPLKPKHASTFRVAISFPTKFFPRSRKTAIPEPSEAMSRKQSCAAHWIGLDSAVSLLLLPTMISSEQH